MTELDTLPRVSRRYIRRPGQIDWDSPFEATEDGRLRNLLDSKKPVISLNNANELQIHTHEGDIIILRQKHKELEIGVVKGSEQKLSFDVKNFANDYEGSHKDLQVAHGYFRVGDDYKILVNPHSIRTDKEEE